MSYYEELSKSCPPRTGTMVGNKDDGYAERLVEAGGVGYLNRDFWKLGDTNCMSKTGVNIRS
jgi:hypothetical protein